MRALWVTAMLLGANPYLDEGQKAYDALLYEQAVARLKLAVEVPTSSIEERRRAHDLLARSLLALGRFEDAEEAYAALLAKDPDAPDPQGAPKVRETFRRAKERLYPPDMVRLERLPSPPGRLVLEVLDPWSNVRELLLYESKDGAFRPRSLAREGRQAAADLDRRHGAPLRYYVVAVRADGQIAASLGSESQPFVVAATAAPPGAVSVERAREPVVVRHVNWPAWALGVTSALAIGAGTAFAFSSAADSAEAARNDVGVERKALDDRAYQKAWAANVLIGAGVAAGAGAAWFVWTFE